MLTCVAGCSKSEDEPAEIKNNSSVSDKENNEEAKEEETKEEEAEATEAEATEKLYWHSILGMNLDSVEESLYISIPTPNTFNRGPGKIVHQEDETIVIFGGPGGGIDKEYEKIQDIDKIFPAYFEETIEIVKAYRDWDFSDFKFELTSQENVKVNDYEMCKYTGVHTYKEEDEKTKEVMDKSMNFVAYATKIKSNNAPVYWMVLDNSEDQSLGDYLDTSALKMAKSVHEDDDKYYKDKY